MSFALRLLPAVVLVVGCDGGPADDTGSDGTFITATVDGLPYEGNSQGAIYFDGDGAGSTELLLFPADPLSGSIPDWVPEQTETWLITGLDGDPEIMLTWIDERFEQHIGQSGSLTANAWTWHTSTDATDPLLGTLGGHFGGVFATPDGSSTLEITDGQFSVRVHRDNTER